MSFVIPITISIPITITIAVAIQSPLLSMLCVVARILCVIAVAQTATRNIPLIQIAIAEL
jgi:hypothetical protein